MPASHANPEVDTALESPLSIHGVLVEFESPAAIVAAARKLHAHGYHNVEAYSPYPIEGLAEATGFTRTRMPLVVLTGAILGGTIGYLMQWWISVVDYPLNIGGRPLHSWPSFIPVTFEMTILVASLFAVLGMLGLNGLPRPHHPLFAVEGFERASSVSCFLCIEADRGDCDEGVLRDLLDEFQPVEIRTVSKTI